MKEGYLLSRMAVKARLLTRRSALAGFLSSYPLLRQLRKGTRVAYLVGEDREDCFYTAEFSDDAVVLTIHSKDSPLYHMQEALLKLLSMLSLLEDFYVPDMRSLYPYLINLLSSYQFSQLSDRLARPKAEQDSDIILAKRINALLREKSDSAEKLKTERRRLIAVLSKFLVVKYGNILDLDSAARETGIERGELEGMLEGIEGLRYRKVRINEGRFSLASR